MNTTSFADVNNTFASSTRIIWEKIVGFMPTFIFAIVVLVIGLIAASLLGGLVTKIARGLKVDKLLTTIGLTDRLEELGINITLSGLFGWVVKWFIIVAVLLTSSGMLGLTTVSEFLADVLMFIPNVLVAVIILTVGLVLGNFMAELVEKSVKMSDFISSASSRTLRSITRWVIILFAIMAALTQLGITPQLIQVFFAGIVAMFALAGGLAFGLGGKDKAKEIIEKTFNK